MASFSLPYISFLGIPLTYMRTCFNNLIILTCVRDVGPKREKRGSENRSRFGSLDKHLKLYKFFTARS